MQIWVASCGTESLQVFPPCCHTIQNHCICCHWVWAGLWGGSSKLIWGMNYGFLLYQTAWSTLLTRVKLWQDPLGGNFGFCLYVHRPQGFGPSSCALSKLSAAGQHLLRVFLYACCHLLSFSFWQGEWHYVLEPKNTSMKSIKKINMEINRKPCIWDPKIQ